MSLTKFRIDRTGQHFYYDNTASVLLDDNKHRLYLPCIDPAAEDELSPYFGQHTKVNNPHTIKITLGHGCNYSCAYCLQKDIGNPDERPSNLLIPQLIKKIHNNLDLSSIERIELWGGETLLYWNDITRLMVEFDREGLMWYIPTNGTPLMDKHVDFWMKLKGTVAIGISHDGPAHEQLRGKEFLHKKVNILRRIQDSCYPKIQFSFNTVISKTNYDLFAIDQFFSTFLHNNNLNPTNLNYELGRVYDRDMVSNSANHIIQDDDIPKYRHILRAYLQAHTQQMSDTGYNKRGKLLTNSLFHIGLGVIPFIKSLRHETIPLIKSNCGADDSRLISLDLEGNVHACQNTDNSFVGGSITNLSGVSISRITTDRSDFCEDCCVQRLCKSSCPLQLGNAVFLANHAIEFAHYSEIQLMAFQILFESKVTQET